jgi:hypothetical protein
MAAACAVIVLMYWTNDDNAGKPDAPRGHGQYLPILDRGDGHMMYLMARSTAIDLDWSFANDLAAYGDPWGQAINPVTHQKEIPHPVGPPLVWTPLIWTAQIGAYAANAFGADIPLDGYSAWHQRFVFLSSVFAALLAILLGRRVAHEYIGGTWSSVYGAVAILLGTSITYYATYMPSYGHALDAGACGAFLAYWALTRGRTDWRRWINLGALLGIAMLIRVQDVAFGVVVALEVGAAVVADYRARRIDWRLLALRWLAGGALTLFVALVVFSPQLVYWHVIYGDWRALPQGARYTRLGSPMILELLFAPRNGWFSTTPLAYAAVLGLFCVPKSARFVALAFGLALALQIYLNSTIYDWWAMASWSQRRLCSVTLVLVFGLAALVWRCGWLVSKLRRVPPAVWHVPALALLAPFVAWNLWRVSDLKAGKAAPMELEPTCCAKTPERLRPYLQWIYDRIGNPFELPASAIFALRHGVEIQRWDQAVGYYALMPSAQSLRDDSMYSEHGGWRIGYPKAEPYLVGHWSGAHTNGERAFRWTVGRRVSAIVPNLLPEPQRFMLWIAPGGTRDVAVYWDDDLVARTTLQPGWQTITFDRLNMPVGEHDLTIEATPAAFPPTDGWPTPKLPVGVAISWLYVEPLRP